MLSKYKVKRGLDDEYEVYDEYQCDYDIEYSGSLADCEAWIRLTEDGRL